MKKLLSILLLAACSAFAQKVNLTTQVRGVLPIANGGTGGSSGVSGAIAAGSAIMGTSPIASGACASVVTATATGTATTNVVSAGFSADPTGLTGYTPSTNGMLTIYAYPSTNAVNFKVCNNTLASITPSAVTVNWIVGALGGGGVGGAPAFSAVTPGTNTSALLMGTGGSLAATGTGTIAATSVNGSVKDSGGQVYNVTAAPYNAVCDGTTDDHVAIQSAITAALVSGGTVRLPAGKACYTGTVGLTLPQQSFMKLTIEGAGGWDSSELSYAGTGTLLKVGGVGGLSRNVILRDLRLHLKSGAGSAAHALDLLNMMYVSLPNVSIFTDAAQPNTQVAINADGTGFFNAYIYISNPFIQGDFLTGVMFTGTAGHGTNSSQLIGGAIVAGNQNAATIALNIDIGGQNMVFGTDLTNYGRPFRINDPSSNGPISPRSENNAAPGLLTATSANTQIVSGQVMEGITDLGINNSIIGTGLGGGVLSSFVFNAATGNAVSLSNANVVEESCQNGGCQFNNPVTIHGNNDIIFDTESGSTGLVYPNGSYFIDFGGSNYVWHAGSASIQRSAIINAAHASGTILLQNQGNTKLQVDAGGVDLAGAAPTCTFTSGGGTSPSCTLDTGSSNNAGIIIATTGTGSPGGTGTITLTFSSALGTNKPTCQYMASDGGAGAWQAGPLFKDKTPATTSDLFTWTNGPTPTTLTASTAYWINYQCFGK